MKKRVISALLMTTMLLSCLSMSMHPLAAEEETTATEPTETTQTTEPTEATEPTEEITNYVSQQMLEVLKQLEGFVAKPYWDYKQWSVGYGSRCPDDKLAEYQERGITKEEAEALMLQELASFEKELQAFIAKYQLQLTQNQYDALVSFSYNCGGGWMSETTGNMYNAIISGDTGAKLAYSMLLWSRAGDEYALLPRRIVELNMYLNGVYEAWTYPENFRYVFLDGAGGTTSYEVHGFSTDHPTRIIYNFKSVPTGPDETGKTVTYEFDGWYTARVGGTKVEQLDDTIATGEVLYAHWKLPSGTQVVVPEPEDGVQLTVMVKKNDVSIRKGKQKFYSVVRNVNAGETVVISEVVSVGSKLWGKVYDGWIRLDDGNTNYAEVKAALMPMEGVVTGDVVNVRKGAGSSYEVLTTVKLGDILSIKDWKSDGSKMWGAFDFQDGDTTVTGWISLEYVSCEAMQKKTLTDVKLFTAPTKLQYGQETEGLSVSGGQIQLVYSDGSTTIISMTEEMISGFDNSTLGEKTLTVTYQGFTTSFVVQIVEPPVTGDFNGDGKFNDQDAVYLLYHYFFPEEYPAQGKVDVNRDGKFNDQDAVYLLYSYFFPEEYPLN